MKFRIMRHSRWYTLERRTWYGQWVRLGKDGEDGSNTFSYELFDTVNEARKAADKRKAGKIVKEFEL